MPVITDTGSLAEFCQRLAANPYITVDTEFMREKTYWPVLCVVQLAGPDEAKAVDALAEGIDLAPLFDLMADTKVLKVFHAARQDLEIFHHLTGLVPAPLFDTQAAAMVCGFGDSAGYETLVKKLAHAKVDKSSRFTDWSHRPLTDRQIEYALGDVTHLRVVYEKLNQKLAATGRQAWLEEEMAILNDPETYLGDPMKSYRRIKSRSPAPKFLAVLRELAAWREIEARRRDQPRGRILRDEALVEIAHHTPANVEDLSRTRGMGKRMADGEAGKAILKAVAAGLAVPESDRPEPPRKDPLPRGLGPVTDLLKVLLKMQCDRHDVAQRLIASGDDLEKIAAFGAEADVAALHGWRFEVFGKDALEVRDGRLALVVEGRKLELVELEDEADIGGAEDSAATGGGA